MFFPFTLNPNAHAWVVLHSGDVALGDGGSACPLALKGPFRLQAAGPPRRHQAFQGLLRAAGRAMPLPSALERLKHLLPDC